jgi:ABC-2 type transport system ATP-binding protein
MIKIDHLTKRYGKTLAVDDLDFEVKPGVVTGFLGPNGSGKSTTMRIILGLDHASKGRATINGKMYCDLKSPLHEVGALLDAKAVHPGRTARNHLRALAASNKIDRSRVDEVPA